MSSQDYYDSQYHNMTDDEEYNMTDDEHRRYHLKLQEKKELADMLAAAELAKAVKAGAATGAAGQKLKNLNLSNVPQRIIMQAIELLKEHGAY